MQFNELVPTADRITILAHKNDLRDDNTPYINHPRAVAELVKNHGAIYVTVALLHDVVEDHEKEGYTYDYFRQQGFPEIIIAAIDSVTKREGESYCEFIKRAGQNEIGRVVKIADITHNLVDHKPSARRDKYELARLYLENTRGIV